MLAGTQSLCSGESRLPGHKLRSQTRPQNANAPPGCPQTAAG